MGGGINTRGARRDTPGQGFLTFRPFVSIWHNQKLVLAKIGLSLKPNQHTKLSFHKFRSTG